MKRILFFFLLTSFLFSCKETSEKKHIEATVSNVKNVSILKKELVIFNLKNEAISHKIWVYLPPDYTTSKKEYPVIYMHDGQNLFDPKTSFAGEWGVDEVLNDLYLKKGVGFIVVGVENVGSERMNEYSPWIHQKYGGGNGDAYLKGIVEDLKPFIDQTYRTKAKAKFTGIIGSSMGGLISYYAGLKYPTVFGKVGVFSPSFWFSEKVVDYTKEKGALQTVKMYFLLGGKEGMTKEFNTVSDTLLHVGFKKEFLKKKLTPNGEHNERFWNSELLESISWLYDIK
jgi:predicted alpha/beta superfamily hydrolase